MIDIRFAIGLGKGADGGAGGVDSPIETGGNGIAVGYTVKINKHFNYFYFSGFFILFTLVNDSLSPFKYFEMKHIVSELLCSFPKLVIR